MPQVVIRHDKTGEEYEIDSADFRRGKHYRKNDPDGETYEEAGFEIVGMPEGQPYTGPMSRASAQPAAAPTEAPARAPKAEGGTT